MLELKSLLSKLLRNYKLCLGDPEEKLELLAELVLKSRNGIKLKISRREWDINLELAHRKWYINLNLARRSGKLKEFCHLTAVFVKLYISMTVKWYISMTVNEIMYKKSAGTPNTTAQCFDFSAQRQLQAALHSSYHFTQHYRTSHNKMPHCNCYFCFILQNPYVSCITLGHNKQAHK